MKKLNVCLLAFTLVGWLSFTSCDNTPRNNDMDNDTIENPNDNILGNQGDAMDYEEERAELREDIQQAQKDIDDRIDELKADMNDAATETKAEMQQKVDQLQATRAELSADLDRLGEDMGDNWESFKTSVRNTLDDLDKRLDDDNDGM